MNYQTGGSNMVNERDEVMEEKDFDADIKLREALIEEVKNLDVSSDWNAVVREISNLKRRWKRISYWESVYEDQLEENFEKAIDDLYVKRSEVFENVKKVKEDLIEKARQLAVTENWNQTTEQMNELMRQWKAAGSAGKDDDALWETFNGIRQKFFEDKHQYFEDMKSRFENARKVKQELIEKAAALADSVEWQKASNQFKELMDQWKTAGSAGRGHEDRLWNEFNESRQKFYERRNQHYTELHAQQKESYAAKKALIAKAQEILAENDFSKENTDKMKELNQQWKAAGFCGKDREDQIWSEFRAVMDEYFAGLKELNEQKHQQWRQRMMENRRRKQDLIANQKRQVKRMQDELVGLLSQREYDDMVERIEDKKDFIAELEEQLSEMDQALNEE